MEYNRIYNEDCLKTVQRMKEGGLKCNMILTSPPYNTGRPSTSERSRENNEGRYDIHLDNMTPEQYMDWCVALFNGFDEILKKDGVIAWNVSYGNDTTVNTTGLNLVWLTIAAIIEKTRFSVADRVIWKKSSALPNNVSPNKLTRIVEDVFIFCRDDEYKTFQANKEVKSISKTGQKFYSPIFNFIEARNNDGKCDLNKATYSSELCEKLLNIYARPGDVVYDPFMGTGTTAVACVRRELHYIGSELSSAQCQFAEERIKKIIPQKNIPQVAQNIPNEQESEQMMMEGVMA